MVSLTTSLAARGQAVVSVLQYTSVKKAFKNDDLRLKVMLLQYRCEPYIV